MRLLILTAITLLAGCTTVDFVRKDFSPERKAVLRFATTSDSDKLTKYRDKVRKKSLEFCNGDYEITREFQAREESGAATGVGTGFGIGHTGILIGGTQRSTAMYNFVEIACR